MGRRTSKRSGRRIPMTDLIVKGLEVAKEIPGNPAEKGGPAKILKVSFENDERQMEIFATAKTNLPSKGDKIPDSDLVFNEKWNRWERKKKGGGGNGGAKGEYWDRKEKRDIEKDPKIQRQHSQE